MTKSVAEDLKILSNIKFRQMESWNFDSKVSELLLALKYFSSEICENPLSCGEFEFEEKEAYSWGSGCLQRLSITLIMICEQLKEIFYKEPRLIRIGSPVYIMGWS